MPDYIFSYTIGSRSIDYFGLKQMEIGLLSLMRFLSLYKRLLLLIVSMESITGKRRQRKLTS